MKKYDELRKLVAEAYRSEGNPKPDWYIRKSHYIDHHLDLYERYWQRRDKQPGNLLDVGTGPGRMAVAFKHLGPSLEVYAFDDNKDTPNGDYGLRVSILSKLLDHYQMHDLTKGFPYESDSFDTIVMADVLEHLWSPRQCLLEIQRCLKPGGLCIISTPNIAEFRNRVAFLLGRNPAGPPLHKFWKDKPFRGHIREYTMSELRTILQWEGLQIIESRFVQPEDYFNRDNWGIGLFIQKLAGILVPSFRKAMIISAAKE